MFITGLCTMSILGNARIFFFENKIFYFPSEEFHFMETKLFFLCAILFFYFTTNNIRNVFRVFIFFYKKNK